jgi:hypothetical protein
MVKKAAPKATERRTGDTMSETSATPTATVTEQPSAGHAIMKGLKILVGIIIGLIGLFLLWYFWGEFALVFKGVVGPVVALIGLVVIILGWTD